MQEIRENVWFVEGKNRGKYPYSHSLYLTGENNVIIDTGAGSFFDKLSTATERVVLSHYHRDHVTYNYMFENAHFYMHREDAPGVESEDGFYRLSGLDQVEVETYWKMVKQQAFSATKIDWHLEEGLCLDTGKVNIKVLHLPGHTPGHCGFLVEECGLIFTTDIDLTRFGPWYGNPCSDLEQFRRSIERVRALKPEIVITGHRRPITKNIEQTIDRYKTVIDRRDEAIITALQKHPLTLEQLTDKNIFYPDHYNQAVLRFFEKNMMQKHLESLLKRGMAIKMENDFYEAL